MDLKTCLQTKLNEGLESSRTTSQQIEAKLSFLEGIDMDNAKYHVMITASWPEHGGKDVDLIYPGSLAGAIKEAERQYKLLNDVTGINDPSNREVFRTVACYLVFISLGAESECIPNEYLTEYAEGMTSGTTPESEAVESLP